MQFEELMDFDRNQIYFIMGLARPKNNKGITKSQRVFFRIPVRSPESYKFGLEKLKADCERTGLKMYMYVSVNARNTLNAYENFKRKQAEYEIQAIHGKKEYLQMLPIMDKLWYSCCMQPNARGTKYFLLDIDTKDPYVILHLRDTVKKTTDILLETETRNGFHWIVRPFDVRIIDPFINVTVQKDGLLYLGCTGFD